VVACSDDLSFLIIDKPDLRLAEGWDLIFLVILRRRYRQADADNDNDNLAPTIWHPYHDNDNLTYADTDTDVPTIWRVS
jgi:hypothetical protein